MQAWRLYELGLCEYTQTLALQKKIQTERKKNTCPNTLLLLEHEPVFTLGNRGGKEFFHKSEEELHAQAISVVPTQRGGYVTYHAPGQLVLYPIISLKEMKMGVATYVNCLEEVMIQICAAVCLSAHREKSRPGVWIDSRKVGSIGVSVSRGVTMHGLALNVNLDVTPFEWISPCGFSNVTMTSLEKESSETISMPQIRELGKQAVMDVFGVSLQPV